MKRMKFNFYLGMLLVMLLAVSCSTDENEVPTITFTTSEENLQVGASKDSRLNISFTANQDWQATVDVDWLTVSPAQGSAGNSTVSLFANEENRTGETRKGTLNLTMNGEVVKAISITQEQKDIFDVAQTAFDIPAAGGQVELVFETTYQGKWLKIRYPKAAEEWLSFENAAGTRALLQGKVVVNVAANTKRSARNTTLQLHIMDDESTVLASSAIITLNQAGASVGVSTDMETDDGKVEQLQRHSQGNGIPLVLMGDGFLDKDIQSGYYKQVMEKAMENLFTEEPIKSLRSYFDVWMVTAVSLNDAFGSAYSTKFSCRLEGGGSTLIEGDDETIQQYVLAVDEIRGNLDVFTNTTVVVILNTEEYAGTAYFGYGTEEEVYEFSICYCPTINGLEDDMFRRVLCHEAVGHAFAKLLDEYSYQEQGTIPASQVENNRQVQQWLGWYMNVDFTSDAGEVIWSRFLNDERYQGVDAWGETLGVYEGAATYWKGAWRPTDESMMRSNMHGFNAPSREAIYKRVMKTGHGTPWQYDYETFVTFDQAHLPHPATTRAAAVGASKPFAAPRFVRRPLIIQQ